MFEPKQSKHRSKIPHLPRERDSTPKSNKIALLWRLCECPKQEPGTRLKIVLAHIKKNSHPRFTFEKSR